MLFHSRNYSKPRSACKHLPLSPTSKLAPLQYSLIDKAPKFLFQPRHMLGLLSLPSTLAPPPAIVRVGITCLTRDPTAEARCSQLGLRQYWSDHRSSNTQGCGVGHVAAGIKPTQFAS